MGLKSSHSSCLKACFLGLRILFYKIFGQTIYWSTAKLWMSPKKRSNDLERSKFRQQVQSFVCVPPWRHVTFKFWEMLNNATEVTLVPKTFFTTNFEVCANKFCGVQSKRCWWYLAYPYNMSIYHTDHFGGETASHPCYLAPRREWFFFFFFFLFVNGSNLVTHLSSRHPWLASYVRTFI
jgi:hypothetical protein